MAKMMGFDIYSNYPINIDYYPVDTLKQAQDVRSGYLLFDEFWEWVHARTSMSLINREMMKICLKNRKRGVSIIYNSQIPRTIDVILKDVTNYRYLPNMVTHKDGKKYIHYIVKPLFGKQSNEMFIPIPIDEIGKYFNTYYEKENNDLQHDSFLKIAIDKYEKPFLSCIKRKKWKAYLNPNSGIGSPYKYDVDMTNKYGRFGINIKSTGKKNVSISNNKHTIKKDMHDFLDNSKQWRYFPLIAFPKKGKTGDYLKFPSNWYIYQIWKGSYFLNHNAMHLDYEKLVKKSILLSKWDGKPFNTNL